MQVILAPPPVPGPGRPAEHRLPVVGRAAIGLGIGPDIPVGVQALPLGTTRLEPAVAVGGVGIDLVDDDLEPQCVRALDQRVEVGEGPEQGIDVAIVGDVIAEIRHRRGKEGRQPDRVDAERGDMVEVAGDARQVADPVAIAVGEAARVDLIDHGASPPGPLAAVLHHACLMPGCAPAPRRKRCGERASRRPTPPAAGTQLQRKRPPTRLGRRPF